MRGFNAWGEEAVGGGQARLLSLEQLGLAGEEGERLEEALKARQGLVLFAGPMGSGKTNTLYSAMGRVADRPRFLVSTIYFPELDIPGVTRYAIDPSAGRTVVSGLGEAMGGTAGAVLMESLRGAGVLELVLRMAASGHLVLAASDGADTAEAVAGKGPDAGGVASALVLVMAQRLMRRVCESCGREVKADAKRLAACGLAPGELPGGRRLREGAGCDACGKTGYKGRVAVYEAMKVTPSLRRLIARGASAGEVRAAAVQEGMRTLRESAVKMVRTGVSTIEEFGKLGLGAAATRAKKKRRARS